MFELRISVVEHRIHNNACLLLLSWAQMLGCACACAVHEPRSQEILEISEWEESKSELDKNKRQCCCWRHADAGKAEEQKNFGKGAEPSQSRAEIVIKNLIFNVFLNWTMTS